MCFLNEYLWWIFVMTWREWNRIFFIYYQNFVFCKIKRWRTFDVILSHIINLIRFIYYILYVQIDEIDFAKNFDLWQIMIESMFDFIWYQIDTRFVRYDSLVFFFELENSFDKIFFFSFIKLLFSLCCISFDCFNNNIRI